MNIDDNRRRENYYNSQGRGRGIDQRGHRGGYQSRETKSWNQGESKSIEHGNETTSRGGHGRGRGTQGSSNRG